MKYFTIRELTKSAAAVKLGINNTPNKEITNSLVALVEHVLDPLRTRYNKPIIVTSGYRCSALNRAVNGSSNSQHLKGEAADITSLGDTRDENMRLLKTLLNSNIEFDQVIAENVDALNRPDWIHVSFTNKGKNRMKRTTMKRVTKNGKTKPIYIDGIKL